MNLEIPELSLVVLIGPSGSGKSTFAKKHFINTEVLSSDFFRALVADDENDMSATGLAFEALHFVAGRRLASGKLTVVDATNVHIEDRKLLIALARQYHCIPIAIVFNLSEKVCQERNLQRKDRTLPSHSIHQQVQGTRRSLRSLSREGFRHVFVFENQEEVDAAAIVRRPLWTNLKQESGPFDIVGDVHGCFDELVTLLTNLGYGIEPGFVVSHPEGRRAIFLGDLVDRGPRIADTLRLVMSMVEGGTALCVLGNHDNKLVRKFRGKNVLLSHGLQETVDQLDREPPEFRRQVLEFLDSRVSHYVLDGGRLVVAHAGLKEEFHGRASRVVREFAIYGETAGETDEFGLPVRSEWAEHYRGKAIVVYGHTPVPEPEWINRTINVDTGCVFGGRLTALQYPEKRLVSVPAEKVYYRPEKPFPAPPVKDALVKDRERDGLLDIKDVSGKRIIATRLGRNVIIREENSIAALEVMSRFAADPRWLIYLPPTMSPSETSRKPGYLEHPAEAFAYYRDQGMKTVVCEEKHMGSRAVVILCRDESVAKRRFKTNEGIGTCLTRTGRPFFEDDAVHREVLDRIRSAMESEDLWTELDTDWICLDCELMPWSAKAQELLREQYAAVGAAARAAFSEVIKELDSASNRGVDSASMMARYQNRAEMTDRYVEAYRRYCWPVRSVEDFKLAPFHLLATEGAVHADKTHLWHIDILRRLCGRDSHLLLPTAHRVVNLGDSTSEADGLEWWDKLTADGGEGMVVKPLDFVPKGRKGMAQPGLKCRGPEYLRIIYGPEYLEPSNLDRLRSRAISAKRSLAIREFALGIEALERFTQHDPLYRVHECCFGILALESEPIDPRL